MDSVDRRTRGAAHLGDHELLLAQFRLVVTDHSTGSGYAYVDDDGVAVAGRRHQPAYGVGADVGGAWPRRRPAPQVAVHHITAANAWALDVGLAARMAIYTRAATCACGR